jgi:hypothetical protein
MVLRYSGALGAAVGVQRSVSLLGQQGTPNRALGVLRELLPIVAMAAIVMSVISLNLVMQVTEKK